MCYDVCVCRTCLSREKRENTKNILTDYLHISTYSMKISIVEAFYEITKLIVDTNEPFTHMICLACVRKLRQAYNFRIMTTKSYETLCGVTDIDQIPYKTEDEKMFYTKDEPVHEEEEGSVESFQQVEEYLQVVGEEPEEDPVSESSIDKVVTEIKKEEMEPGEIREFINLETKKPVRIVKKTTTIPKIQSKMEVKRTTSIKKEPNTKKSHGTSSKETLYCDLCPAQFTNTRACFIHMKKFHMSKKPYKCWYEGCGRLYRSAGQRSAHQNTVHLKLKRFICATCGMSFTDNPKLTSHTRIHTGERPYKCDFPNCTAQFKQQYDLTKHKNSIHSTERPWVCEVCQATFKLKGGLRAHRRLMHSRENLKKCSDCEKEFLNVAALNNHYNIIHLGQRNHVCQICARNYAYRKHMLRHVKESHPVEYQQMIDSGEIVIRMREQLYPNTLDETTGTMISYLLGFFPHKTLIS
uniref:CSON014596 protein n=1 Tax=Culicoides sonorensis TaxID=179676 RepID=A0A336KS20_CULSO